MKRLLAALASPPVTLAGFAVLAVVILCGLHWPQLATFAYVAPLAALGLNLVAAIATRPALRRGGLGVFHFALLAFLLLALWGRLTHFDARVEVAEEGFFDPALVQVTGQGPWHGDAWKRLQFRQGRWEVDYRPGVKRAHTRSLVWLPDDAAAPRTVGDDSALLLAGYRFYTTPNKGFAPLLTWQQGSAPPQQGVLHMPSYPMFDWRQENTWTAPGGGTLRFWLRLDRPIAPDATWTLSPRDRAAVLVVEAAGTRHELRPGESIALPQGTLRYDRLLGWMGYRIFYDPTLLPLLLVALAGVAGLAWHLWQRTSGLAPRLQEAAA